MTSNTYPRPTLKHLPLRERPVYRVSHGVDSCNLAELLAAVIGGSQQIEIAHALLAEFENLGNLVRASTQELEAIAGLGSAGAATGPRRGGDRCRAGRQPVSLHRLPANCRCHRSDGQRTKGVEQL